MRVWHRLHVFAQVLNVLCVIGGVVPVAGHQPSWQTTLNFAASNTSDTRLGESSTTSENGVTENFQERPITEDGTIVTQICRVLDDLSTPRPEIDWRTEPLAETSTVHAGMKKKIGHHMVFAARSLDLIEVDVDNVIDTTDSGNVTEEPELLLSSFAPTDSTLRDLSYTESNTATTKNGPVDKDEVIVEGLKILNSTTNTLTVSWKRLQFSRTVTHYDVRWYQKETAVGACRIPDEERDTYAVLIDSLNACTTYRVSVLAVLDSPNRDEATVNGTTVLEVTKDSVKLGVSAVGNEWIELTWTMPCTDCVFQYGICVYDNENCEKVKTNKTTHIMDDLSPGASYIFELTIEGPQGPYGSINVTGETTVPKPEIKECEVPDSLAIPPMGYLEGSSPALLQNLETAPNKIQQTKDTGITVGDLWVVGTTSTTLNIAWEQPNTTLDYVVSYYIIEWYNNDDADSSLCKVSNETFSYVIPSLAPCTMYTARVTPQLVAANGTKRVVSGTTGLNVHKDTLNLKVVENGTDFLKISWNMPSTDCVSHYGVLFCDGENCTDHKTNNTTYYEKKGLQPCRTYDFSLTVYKNQGAYGSLNITGTTAFLAPGKPSPATTESGNYGLLVSWPEPEGYTCINHYRVVWSRADKNGNTIVTKNNSLLLRGLDSCATYEIVIIAVDICNGDSAPEIIWSNMTAPAVSGAPVLLGEPSPTENKISIKWQVPTNENNNCIQVTLVVECRPIKALGIGYEPVVGKSVYTIPEGTTNETINATVMKVSPFTSYDCWSYTMNSYGRSEDSRLIRVETLESVPPAPILLPESSSNVTNTSITLQWNKPKYVPGKLRNIMIQVTWQYNWPHPYWCTRLTGMQKITDIDGTVTSYEYSPVTPYSIYGIRIAASTGAGWGPDSKAEKFHTKPGAPGKVTDLCNELQEKSEDPNILENILKWRAPCFFNGKNIEYFNVLGKGVRDGFQPHYFTQIVNYTSDNCFNDTCSLVTEQLREEHNYSIEIAAKGMDYQDLGERSEVTFMYPAGIPPQPAENYTSIISIDPYKALRTTETAKVLLPVFPDTNGKIKCYAVIVAKIGYNNASFGRLKDNAYPHVATWKESSDKDFEIPYEAMKICSSNWDDELRFSYLKNVHSTADTNIRTNYPATTNIVSYGRFKVFKVILGDDREACPEMSTNGSTYCNGPLNPDTVYHVRMRAFTAGGYSDSIVFTVKTNSELQVALVIGTIFGILLLGILMTMMLLVRKCSLQAVLRRFLHSDMPGSPVPAPFTRRKFIAHCQQLADNPGKLSNEYQLLQTLSVDLQMPTNAACLQANRKKNRYTDILPYDFSRVKLEVIDNDPNTDYINASFIKGFTGEEDYIACQGPKEETTYDFWRMIDQYDVKLIVMLTQLVEKNKEKCHQYFPTIRETFTYENMAIRCSTELDYRTYTHRTLVLQKENAKRNIIHLHFKDWPDHDVPEDFDPMINFCQIMRRHMETSRGLVVIHCSAGIGRTGTLIAIDILLQHIKDNRKLDVFGTVYRLRHHRINMVQRESQYAYIYNCIRQVLKNPYFSKTYKPPSVDPICDNTHKKKETSESNTDLVSSFETLKKSSFSTSVESAEPIYQTPTKSSSKSRMCYSLNGLRCAKSTGAIDTRPYQQSICRYNTHDHPISEIAKEALISSSRRSLDMTESEGSTTSIYENIEPLSRSKSSHAFEGDEDLCVVQKLLEHDTSV